MKKKPSVAKVKKGVTVSRSNFNNTIKKSETEGLFINSLSRFWFHLTQLTAFNKSWEVHALIMVWYDRD